MWIGEIARSGVTRQTVHVRSASLCAAIVLHAYDIGEADRLCVLLTRSYGKIAARAYGVRQCASRMGGVVLPLHHIDVSLHAGRSGWCIREARLVRACTNPQPVRLQEGMEILMLLLEDEEPVPEIFTLVAEFVSMCPTTLIPFTMKLLHMMGVLPTSEEDERFRALSSRGRNFVRCCARPTLLQYLESVFPHDDDSLPEFYDAVLRDQLPRPLRSASVVSVLCPLQ